MNILLVGSGGREHALAWALAKSPKCTKLFCAPGNAGIKECATLVEITAEDVDALTTFAKDKAIDLVVVGPEVPLVAGLADKIKAAGIPVFGPDQAAAQLEGSKGFMKDLCAKYNIPTAAYGRFTDLESATKFIQDQPGNVVVKTDGLAAGKGVIMCDSKDDAIQAAREMLEESSFGNAGAEIIIEEFMDGEELSYFALADGRSILPLTSAQDHKRAFDNDQGPNTGGMGAYSPAHFITDELENTILETIIKPTVAGMAAEGCAYTGVLYAGLMVVNGVPKLIEYNVRFGDPECQPIMMRLQGDLVDILHAGATSALNTIQDQVSWSDQTALCVVMAAKGYPGSYEKNTKIENLKEAAQTPNTVIFHAGTKTDDNGDTVSIGGRVLGVTALGNSVEEAQTQAYKATKQITWPQGFYRNDIGWRAVRAEKEKAA
jgi:phosphoribosylamine--glycine ligase